MLPYHVFPSHIWIIQVHGLFEAIGFFVAIMLLARYVKKKYNDKLDNIYSISLWVIIGSVVGARLAYIIGNFDFYKDNLMQIFNLLGGGLSYFGGLVGAVLFAYLYCKRKKLNFLEYADLFAVYIPLGHAIGRIGDYLIGEHIGKATDVAWAVMYDGELRHNIPLYDILFNLGLFLSLLRMRKMKLKQGMLIIAYMLGYGTFRLLTGFLRVDEKMLNSLSIIQYFTIALIIMTAMWMILRKKYDRKVDENSKSKMS